MRQLTKAEPDLKEVHAILSDIVAGGQRIKDIIGGVRTMFKESAHDRQLLNLNKVVRDVLATVELDIAPSACDRQNRTWTMTFRRYSPIAVNCIRCS